MADIILFVIGTVSILLNIWFEITRFRNKEYNPRLFRARQESKWSIKDFVVNFCYIIPSIWIKDIRLRGIYVLFLLLVITITYTILNFLCYQSDKNKKIMIQTVIFDIVTIILAIIIVSVFLIH